jgi:hypothetical protein
MMPSLVLITSDKKRLVTWTRKRSLMVGTDPDCDIVVNHPHLNEQPQILGPGSPREDPLVTKGAIVSFFFPAYTFSLDGLNVRMVPLKAVYKFFLIACAGILTAIFLLNDHSASSISQDWTPITLPAAGVYGFCRQDRSHGEGVRFSFEAQHTRSHRLVFFAGGQGDGTSIALSLNGNVIRDSLTLPAGWGEEMAGPLPSVHIRNGSNLLEIRPESTTGGSVSWGISEVRALVEDSAGNSHLGLAVREPQLISRALEKQDISGPELAHYHKIVSRWETSTPSGVSSGSRKSIMEEIEKRMRSKLHQVAFDVRSRNILGDQPAVRQLLDETRSWIPEDWPEGWEIYHELCR